MFPNQAKNLGRIQRQHWSTLVSKLAILEIIASTIRVSILDSLDGCLQIDCSFLVDAVG